MGHYRVGIRVGIIADDIGVGWPRPRGVFCQAPVGHDIPGLQKIIERLEDFVQPFLMDLIVVVGVDDQRGEAARGINNITSTMNNGAEIRWEKKNGVLEKILSSIKTYSRFSVGFTEWSFSEENCVSAESTSICAFSGTESKCSALCFRKSSSCFWISFR